MPDSFLNSMVFIKPVYKLQFHAQDILGQKIFHMTGFSQLLGSS